MMPIFRVISNDTCLGIDSSVMLRSGLNKSGNCFAIADLVGGVQVGEKIFRQAKQKAQGILDVLPSIFARDDGKDSAEMRADGRIGDCFYQRKWEKALLASAIWCVSSLFLYAEPVWFTASMISLASLSFIVLSER